MAQLVWDDEVQTKQPQVVWDDEPAPKGSSFLGNVAGGLVQGAANIGSTILAPIDWAARQAGISNDYIGRDDRRSATRGGLGAMGADTDSLAFKGGELASEIAGTAGVGGVLARGINAVGRGSGMLSKLATAAETGGFAKGQTDSLIRNAAYRTGGGVLAGGASAALVDPSTVTEGAMYGGALPVVGSLARGGVSGAGWLRDLAGGTLAERHAGRIARQAAGPQLDMIREANDLAPNGMLATQVAENFVPGGAPGTYNRLGQVAEGMDATDAYRLTREAQAAAQRADLERLAGAENATAARDTSRRMKDAVSSVTVPAMDVELEAANTAGRLAPELAARVGRQRGALASALQDQGRMATDAAQAASLAEGRPINLAARQSERNPFNVGVGGGTVGRPLAPGLSSDEYVNLPILSRERPDVGNLLNRVPEAQSAADDFAQVATNRRAQAGLSQYQLDSLAAHGLNPLDGQSVTQQISALRNSPSVRGVQQNRAALDNVIGEIEREIAASGGIPDARVLHDIRKTAINATIEQLIPGATAKEKAKRAAGLLTQIKPVIDNALERAGATGWREAMDAHAAGMRAVERQQMGAELLGQFNQSTPNAFLKTASLNNPKAVEKIFGPGKYDLAAQMGDDMRPVQRVAGALSRDAEIARKGAAATQATDTLIANETPIIRGPALLHPAATLINRFISGLENRVKAQTLDLLTEGMKSGASANRLLAMVPAEEKSQVMQWIAKGNLGPYLQSLQAASQ